MGGQVDDLGLVDAGDLVELGPVGGGGRHLDEQQLPLQAVVGVQPGDLAGLLQTGGLLDDLIQHLFIVVDHHGDAGDGGVVGGRHGEAVDVEAPAGKQAGYPGQNARVVLHQHADYF